MNLPPTSLPITSLWVIPMHQPQVYIIAIMKPFRNLTLRRSIILYDDLITNYTFISFQFIYLYGHKAVFCHPAYLNYMKSTL